MWVSDNDNDAGMYLNNTIVMYNHTPVYVVSAGEKRFNYINLEDLEEDFPEECWGLVENINEESPPLGFYFNGEEAIYLVRFPSRNVKLGIDLSKVMGFVIRSNGFLKRKINKNIEGFQLKKAMMNDYPSLEEAFYKLQDGCTSCPFHRYLCLSYDANKEAEPTVFFKNRPIGFYDKGCIALYQESSFLLEFIQENIGEAYVVEQRW